MGPIYRKPPVYKLEPRRKVPILGDFELGGIHKLHRRDLFYITQRDIEHEIHVSKLLRMEKEHKKTK